MEVDMKKTILGKATLLLLCTAPSTVFAQHPLLDYDCQGQIRARGSIPMEIGFDGESLVAETVVQKSDDRVDFSIVVKPIGRNRSRWFRLCFAGQFVRSNSAIERTYRYATFDTDSENCNGTFVRAGRSFAIGSITENDQVPTACHFTVVRRR